MAMTAAPKLLNIGEVRDQTMTIVTMIILSAAALMALSHIAAVRVHRQRQAQKLRVPVRVQNTI